jgi:uridine kinase
MKDDRIFVKDWHRRAAAAIVGHLASEIDGRLTLSVGGESGSGKSEIAVALKDALEERGFATGILQADDYFIYMSKVCDAMRRKAIELVGPMEVKLDFMDSHLRAFKEGAVDLYKPVAVYRESRFEREVMPVADLKVLIAEGTYCTVLEFADRRIFIDRDYQNTLDDRRARGRDLEDEHTNRILHREHEFIREHKPLAHFVVNGDASVERREPVGPAVPAGSPPEH